MSVRPRRALDDEFFTNGDEVSLCNPSSHVIYCIEESVCFDSDTKSETSDAETGSNININHSSATSFPCPVYSCHQMFYSMTDFQNHYELNHVYQCSVCQLVLPSDYLLDLHLEEKHDTYFITALERGRAFYQCLSHSCALTFDNETDRKHHLQHVHGYPKWFRFHPMAIKSNMILDGSSTNRKTKSQSSLPCEKHKWRQKYLGGDKSIVVKHYPDCSTEENTGVFSVSKERNERRKLKNATISCRYHMNGRCWRGSRCMFLHETIATQDVETVDELTQRLETVAPFQRRKTRIQLK